jgi:hypothetical protein
MIDSTADKLFNHNYLKTRADVVRPSACAACSAACSAGCAEVSGAAQARHGNRLDGIDGRLDRMDGKLDAVLDRLGPGPAGGGQAS